MSTIANGDGDRIHGLMIRKDFRAALAEIGTLLAGDGLSPADRYSLLIKASRCEASIANWTGAEAFARKATEIDADGSVALRLLGDALIQLQRREEAAPLLGRALTLNPEDATARALLAIAMDGPATPDAANANSHRQVSTWPSRTEAFRNPRALIERYVLAGLSEDRFIEPRTVFMTLGSCFADNIGKRLTALGYKTHSERIGEQVNNTYANRYLLEWIEAGAVSPPTETIERAFGPETRKRLLGWIAKSDVFVVTLGVAATSFDRNGGFAFNAARSATAGFHFALNHTMRTTTVAENVANLEAMLATIRRVAKHPPRFVLTVSPVPLTGSTEFSSAVVADSLSKSTLRLACQEVLEANPRDTIYWPSFEMVRWLGAHYFEPAYGERDGNSRHVSPWLIDLIVDLFVDRFAVKAEPLGAAMPVV